MEQSRGLLTFKIPLSGFIQECFIDFERFSLRPISFRRGKVDTPLLLSGLMYREICHAMEMEPDAPTGAPKSLINSPFSIKELKEIEAVLDNVVVDATDA